MAWEEGLEVYEAEGEGGCVEDLGFGRGCVSLLYLLWWVGSKCVGNCRGWHWTHLGSYDVWSEMDYLL